MNRNTLNFVIDLITLVVMWGLLTTGLLIRYVLPAGSGHWLTLNGWNRHDWGDVHFWLAATTCALILIHAWMHWQWVCATVRRIFARTDTNGVNRSRAWRTGLGVGTIALLTAVTAALLVAGNGMTVERSRQTDEEHAIRGSSTLAAVAAVKELSMDELRQRLGVSADVPASETLGRLARRHGFTMSEARARLGGSDPGRQATCDESSQRR